MSAIRKHTCAEPGPYGTHCTQPRYHDWSCYDAGEDVSFNHRQAFEHTCTDPDCLTPHFVNEGD